MWSNNENDGLVPIHGGRDAFGNETFICRAWHSVNNFKYFLIPGNLRRGLCSVAVNGKVYFYRKFRVLKKNL
jgi:hypothetical protein